MAHRLTRREIFLQTLVAIIVMNFGCKPSDALDHINAIRNDYKTSYAGATRLILSLPTLG